MSYLHRFFILSKKLGLDYSILYTLKKANIIKEIPIKVLLKKQDYYKNLSLENQKKELSESYYVSVGKYPNIDNPKDFCEKIQWLKFNDSTKRKADLSDKYLAPKLLMEKYSNEISFIKQLGAWDRAEDIDFSKLPDSFVLKCNHGSAMNIIVKDKSKLNLQKTVKKLNNWMKIDYAYVNGMYENHYSLIERKIIAEEFIQEMDGNLHDYKFHCFNGNPIFIEFIGDREPNTHKIYSSIYDINWNKLDIQLNNDLRYENSFEKPNKLNEMIKLAKEMSKGFYYVRVDFYFINNKIYFGELTFTPDSGFITFNNEKIDREWGDLIKL